MRKGDEQDRPVSGSNQLSSTTPVEMASARSFGSRNWRILQTTRMRPVVLCFFVVLLSMPIHAATAYAAGGREIAASGNGRDAPACSVRACALSCFAFSCFCYQCRFTPRRRMRPGGGKSPPAAMVATRPRARCATERKARVDPMSLIQGWRVSIANT